MLITHEEDFGWILKIDYLPKICFKCEKELKIPFFICEWHFFFMAGELKRNSVFYCANCNLNLPIRDLCRFHDGPKALVGKETEEHAHTCIRKVIIKEGKR